MTDRMRQHFRNPRAFNLACGALGAAILAGTVLGRHWTARNVQDFPQFYMGAVIARNGEWESMYPVPLPGSERNAGEHDTSTMKPGYARLAAEAGVPDAQRYIQAPPFALVLLPLGALTYERAHLAWTLLSIGFGLAIAWQAGAAYRRLAGGETRAEGLVTLLVAASPNMYQSCRMGQVSTLIGACLGVAVLGLASPAPAAARTGFAIFLATMVKYIGAILLPVALAMRRFATVAWALALGAAAFAASAAIVGWAPWREWLTVIAPTLARSHAWAANQSAYGVAVRVTGTNPPPPAISVALKAASATTLVAILGLLFTRRRAAWTRPGTVFAACTALLAWSHVFSPIFWNHYYAYLFPLWGWLAWEARRSRVACLVVAAAFALAWVPVGIIPSLAQRIPEAARDHMLVSAALVLGFAIVRLAQANREGLEAPQAR